MKITITIISNDSVVVENFAMLTDDDDYSLRSTTYEWLIGPVLNSPDHAVMGPEWAYDTMARLKHAVGEAWEVDNSLVIPFIDGAGHYVVTPAR